MSLTGHPLFNLLQGLVTEPAPSLRKPQVGEIGQLMHAIAEKGAGVTTEEVVQDFFV